MRWVAVGQDAVGVFAFGQLATGVVAVGQGALGVIAIGQVARGVFSAGQLALGVVSFGQLAVGLAWAAGMLPVAPLVGVGVPMSLAGRWAARDALRFRLSTIRWAGRPTRPAIAVRIALWLGLVALVGIVSLVPLATALARDVLPPATHVLR